MRKYFTSRVFRPTIIPTIITLLLLPVLLRLGFWQLERAEEKEIILQQFEAANSGNPLDLQQRLELKPALNYRNARVKGRYMRQYLIFHENQVHNRVPGYHVLIPFKISNSNMSVLVNLGWVAMKGNRGDFPDVQIPQGEITLNGKLKIISEKTFTLGDISQSNEGWPALAQWINIDDIADKSQLQLQPFVVLLDAAESHGYVRNWVPVVMLPEKSISYAVQWFALALVLLIIYVMVNMKKIEEDDSSDVTARN